MPIEQVTALLNSVWNYVLVDIAKSQENISVENLSKYRNDLLARTPEVKKN
jgi:hypothetical protein